MRLQIKISMLALGVLLCGGVMSFSTYNQNQKSPKSIVLKNVNALARSEGEGGGHKVTCYCTFENYQNGTRTTYDCGSCSRVTCTNYSDKRTCKTD